MKKSIIAVCIALLIAGPAMALDGSGLDMSGSLKVEGMTIENNQIRQQMTGIDVSSAREPAMVSQIVLDGFNLLTTYKVNDNLSIVTELDAFDDYIFGGNTTNTITTADASTTVDVTNPEVDWDQAYMQIISPVGVFRIGRMSQGEWGTSFGNNESSGDFIAWAMPLMDKKIWIGASYRKVQENDNTTDRADDDMDEYGIGVKYTDENIDAGIGYTFYDYQGYIVLADHALIDGGDDNYMHDGTVHGFAYYVDATFGMFGIKSEVAYAFGDAEVGDDLDNADDTEHAITKLDGTAYTRVDKDVDFLTGFIEPSVTLGPVKVFAGFAYLGGDTNPYDNTEGSMGFLKPGCDWGRTALMFNNKFNNRGAMGGATHGALNADQGNLTPLAGYQAWYLGVDVTPIEDLTITLVGTTAVADDAPKKDHYIAGAYNQADGEGVARLTQQHDWEEDYGDEFNLSISYDMFGGALNYTFIYAYLSVGDFWLQDDVPGREGNAVAATYVAEDVWGIYHSIKVSF